MALCWKNITVARTNCGADIFGLAGFLRDDDLISHDDPLGKRYLTAQLTKEHIENIIGRSGQAVGVRPWLKSPIMSRCRSPPPMAARAGDHSQISLSMSASARRGGHLLIRANPTGRV